MISRSDDPGKRINRVLRIALVISLLLHPLAVATVDAIHRALERHQVARTAPHPQASDEVITISSAARHAKRSVAEAGVMHPPPRVARRPHPKVDPIRPQQPQPLQPKVEPELAAAPTFVPKIEEHAERPHSTPEPQKRVETTPSPEPVATPRKIAYVKPPEPPKRPALYSPEQIAQIQSDLARAVTADRRNAALSDSTAIAATASTKKYDMDFSGINGTFGGAQGLCWPIKEWLQAQYVFAYMQCRVMHRDGSVRMEGLPWPWRQLKSETMYDPRSGFYENVVANKSIDPPDPGWKPDPHAFIDPDVRQFLRQNGFDV